MYTEAETKAAAPFVCHGMELEGRTGNQLVGSCPLCLEDRHFYLRADKQLWDCKKCGESGNLWTFLDKVARRAARLLRASRLGWLAANRGLDPQAFKGWEVGFNGREYLLPVRSNRGTVRDLRRWNPKVRRLYSTSGCHTQLYNLHRLVGASPEAVVWICEGEWDTIALAWLLKQAGRDEDVAVGVPGASIFKAQWVQWFAGRKVRLCYDADGPGDKGAKRAEKILKGAVRQLEFLRWPENMPEGYDIRDYVTSIPVKRSPRVHLEKLEELVQVQHRRDALSKSVASATPGDSSGEDIPVTLPADQCPTFKDVIDVFETWLLMDREMKWALLLCLAIIASENMDGDPVWLHLVAPAGGGKTSILAALAGSPQVFFRTTVTPQSLISGFKMAEDPSILAQVNRKALIIKDGTNLVTGPQLDWDATMGILRDAFDGHVIRSWGNNVFREYYLHFSMIMGVTPIIHSKNDAMAGERFLKFNMMSGDPGSREARILAAIQNVNREASIDSHLQDVVARFLQREFKADDLPVMPRWVQRRVVALAQLLSHLRASVPRDRYDRDLVQYRPSAEVGTRPAKQMVKLCKCIGWCLRKPVIDWEVFQVVERVILDTATGFHLDIIGAILRLGNWATREEIAKAADVPEWSTHRAIEDLLVMKLVRFTRADAEEGRVGRKAHRWSVDPALARLWRQAQIGMEA